MEQTTLTTKGMHCGGCASRIEQTLGHLEGVRQVKADHTSQQVEVAFDGATLDEATIRSRVEALGFEVV